MALIVFPEAGWVGWLTLPTLLIWLLLCPMEQPVFWPVWARGVACVCRTALLCAASLSIWEQTCNLGCCTTLQLTAKGTRWCFGIFPANYDNIQGYDILKITVSAHWWALSHCQCHWNQQCVYVGGKWEKIIVNFGSIGDSHCLNL